MRREGAGVEGDPVVTNPDLYKRMAGSETNRRTGRPEHGSPVTAAFRPRLHQPSGGDMRGGWGFDRDWPTPGAHGMPVRPA